MEEQAQTEMANKLTVYAVNMEHVSTNQELVTAALVYQVTPENTAMKVRFITISHY